MSLRKLERRIKTLEGYVDRLSSCDLVPWDAFHVLMSRLSPSERERIEAIHDGYTIPHADDQALEDRWSAMVDEAHRTGLLPLWISDGDFWL